mgnify:CR=1 FL=1
MKNILIYIAGVLTGIVLTILIAIFLAPNNNENTPVEKLQGITLFDEPGDSVDTKQFKVFQVIDNGVALAFSEEKKYGRSFFRDPVVLLLNDEGKLYYDDEIVKVPQGQNARHMGIYQYSTESGYKTVPIIKIIK